MPKKYHAKDFKNHATFHHLRMGQTPQKPAKRGSPKLTSYPNPQDPSSSGSTAIKTQMFYR